MEFINYCTKPVTRGRIDNPMANKNYRQHRLIIDGREYVDGETLAPMLGRCEETVRRLARSGELPAIKDGRRWWFHLPTINEMRYLKQPTYKEDLQTLGF